MVKADHWVWGQNVWVFVQKNFEVEVVWILLLLWKKLNAGGNIMMANGWRDGREGRGWKTLKEKGWGGENLMGMGTKCLPYHSLPTASDL